MFILCILMLQQFVLERMKLCHMDNKNKLFEIYNKNTNINNGRNFFYVSGETLNSLIHT